MYADMCDLNNIYYAYANVKSKSAWKYQTQLYDQKFMVNLAELRDRLVNHAYKPDPVNGFIINERGKPRWITSRSINDRIVQKLLHQYVVLPAIQNKLIYDNSASLANRGVDFFRRRLLMHLSDFAAEYGNDGYILIIDFSKFFDNIQHPKLIEMFKEIIPERESMDLVETIINSDAIDVSYMSDEEYANCMNVPFNSIEYRLAVANGIIQCTGEKYMHKCMDIGSQLSQDAGIYYPYRLDNYIKIVKSVKGYARYMDDSYVIHHSLDFIKDVLYNGVYPICNEYGIFLNPKKTQIVNLKHEFSILHVRYKLHENGDITIMPNNDTFSRERRKLDKEAEKYKNDDPNITYNNIRNEYIAWRGNACKMSCKAIQAVQDMDMRFCNNLEGYIPIRDMKKYFAEVSNNGCSDRRKRRN